MGNCSAHTRQLEIIAAYRGDHPIVLEDINVKQSIQTTLARYRPNGPSK